MSNLHFLRSTAEDSCLLDCFDQPAFIVDRSYVVVVANQAASILFRTPKSKLLHTLRDYPSVSYLCPHATAPTMVSLACQALAGQVSEVAGYTIRELDGTITTLHARAYPRRNRSGRIEDAVLVFTNIGSYPKFSCDEKETGQGGETTREALLVNVLNQMPSGVIVAENPEGAVLFANQYVSQVLGEHIASGSLNPENCSLRHTDGRMLAPDEYPLTRSRRFGETIQGVEYLYQKSDGEARTFVLSSAPIRSEKGSILAGVVTFQDITERKRLEALYKIELNNLKRQFDNSPLAILECDADMKISYWSPGAERMFGWSAETMVGLPLVESPFIGAVDAPGILAAFQGLREEHEKLNIRVNQNITETGQVLTCEWFNSVSSVENGRPVSFLSFATDVTGRIRAEREREAALARAQGERARFYEVLQRAPAMFFVSYGPFQILEFVNERFLDFFPNRSYLGSNVRDVLPELASQGICDLLDHVYSSGEAFIGSEQSLTLEHDGIKVKHHISISCQAIRSTDGVIEGIATYAFDVTDSVNARVRLEDLARREEIARKQAEDANLSKDEFLASLSHELRTPLNAMLGWSRILRQGDLDAERTKRALETIERNAIAQARLIEDLLDISRIVSGNLRLDVQTLQLRQVIDAAVEAVRPAIDAKQHRITVVLDPQPIFLIGDPTRLQQVICNLLSNATKFTPKSGHIELFMRQIGPDVEIRVTDNGQGFGAEFLPRMFDRFVQADGTFARSQGGLGLGLAISRHLAELHGGSIQASSAGIGLGATFTVRLPHSRVSAPEVVMSPFSNHLLLGGNLGAPPQLFGVRVLVVDDQPDARELVAAILQECNVRVRTVGSSEEALAAIGLEIPDVLISDIGMPGRDGFSLIRDVRALPVERGGKIPALALTAYVRSEDRDHTLSAGFQMHLPKPVQAFELRAVVASLAGLSHGSSQGVVEHPKM